MEQNLFEKMSGGKNWLQRLAERVPGYGGYYDKERRRDADRVLREFLSRQLNQGRKSLLSILQSAAPNNQLDGLDKVDELCRRLEKVADNLAFSNYGYTGLFAQLKIAETDLERLYQHDFSLAETVTGIVHAAAELRLDDGLAQSTQRILQYLASLEKALDDRELVVRGIEGGKP